MLAPSFFFIITNILVPLAQTFDYQTNFSTIIDLYNKQQFSDLYYLQGQAGRATISRRDFVVNLTEAYKNNGFIVAQINLGLVYTKFGYGLYGSIVSFDKVKFKQNLQTLGFSILGCFEKDDQLAMIVLTTPTVSTLNFYNSSNNFGSANLFINDAKVYDSNGDTMRPVGTAMSQIIVGLEFANQVISGRLNATQKVNISEIQRYVIPDFDQGEANITKLKKTVQSLQKVVQLYLKTNSYAVGEYLMDLLGIDNLKKLLIDLDVNQTDIFYPSSFYLAFTGSDQESLNVTDYISQLNQTIIEQKMNYIHDRLKNLQNTSDLVDNFLTRIFENKKITDLIGKYQQQSTSSSYAWLCAQIIGFNLSLSSGQDPEKVLAFYYATVFPSKGLVNLNKLKPTMKILSDYSVTYASRQGVYFEESQNLYINLCGQYEFVNPVDGVVQASLCIFSTNLTAIEMGDQLSNLLYQNLFFGYSYTFRTNLMRKLNITV